MEVLFASVLTACLVLAIVIVKQLDSIKKQIKNMK